MWHGFLPCGTFGISCHVRDERPASPRPLFLLVAGDFAFEYFYAAMEDKSAKPACPSKGDPSTLPSSLEALPAGKVSSPVPEGRAWMRPPPPIVPPPPARQRKPKSS